jgi:hypothetical protein
VYDTVVVGARHRPKRPLNALALDAMNNITATTQGEKRQTPAMDAISASEIK